MQLDVQLSGQHLRRLSGRQAVVRAAALVHSPNPSAQGLAGPAHLSRRFRHKQRAVNYVAELLQLLVCHSGAVKKFQVLGEEIWKKHYM